MPLSFRAHAATAATPSLQVTAGAGPGQPLLSFSLGAKAMKRAIAGTGLVWLGGDFSREHWQVPAIVDSGDARGGWWVCGRDLMAVAVARPDCPSADPEAATCELYRELIDTVRAQGYPELLRVWNFLPGINFGAGDQERYRRFCVGRGRALSEAGLDDAAMCAATAIGSDDRHVRVFALAGRSAGLSIENPRQVPAWEYPRAYGPRSPAFARATAISLQAGRVGLMISGTASVVGHATVHPGHVLAQTDEAASNIEALLKCAADQLGESELGRLGPASLVRVYVRQAGDWPAIEARLRQRWPNVPLAGLRGDVCRRDLLVEIEAWHCSTPSPVHLSG